MLKIQTLNVKENKISYCIKQDKWDELLEIAFEDAVFTASVEVANGIYKPVQLLKIIDKFQSLNTANRLLSLTYLYSGKALRDAVYQEFSQLPGGEEWDLERQ